MTYEKKTVAASKANRGFSVLELVLVVAIIFILGVLVVPTLMTQAQNIRIRYAATDLSGLLQRARMEAVRTNSFYSLQNAGGNPVMIQVVDKNGAVVRSIQPFVMGNTVNGTFGAGSGAPGEAGFLATLPYPTAAAGSGSPSFNARGLPCIPTGALCTPTPGQGFIFFLGGNSGSSGAQGWAAVSVTPAGRCTVWAFDGQTWSQQ